MRQGARAIFHKFCECDVVYSIRNMCKPFFDDLVKTFGYYNFLPDALDDLKYNDDIVVLPPDAHYFD
ncbi:unnamed protein product [Acanthoscelides obtectus]|uniref:Uncharacterized protein n=1 Tax=Acanthoscelides obtectus TaxID=200917 RepID=A0A9P0L1L4_ACAOB|nr:unnamed protein product [Acanthoscelides obtectus]CAK1652280.1 hypothetical protein AOBTE_LOCUS17764 [Acanthoscelides obtectus]